MMPQVAFSLNYGSFLSMCMLDAYPAISVHKFQNFPEETNPGTPVDDTRSI